MGADKSAENTTNAPFGGGGCSFGFGFQEPFNGDAISGLVKKSKSAFFLRICQIYRSGSALNCG